MISYPESDIIWIFYSNNNHKPRNNKHSYNEINSLAFASEMEDAIFIPENYLILNSELKYSIFLKTLNKTHKTSSILINIDDEKDLGIYSCFANNSVGSKSMKFFIYGSTNIIK